VQNSEAEIARANYRDIRLFFAQEAVSEQPRDDLRGGWQKCSPESVRPFSAVAYFFARELFLTQQVPIGMIGSYIVHNFFASLRRPAGWTLSGE
jgi:sialate O-acetylesterase